MKKKIIILLSMIVVLLIFSSLYNLPSNFEYIYNQSGKLNIKCQSDWVPYTENISNYDSKTLFVNNQVSFSELRINRDNYGIVHKLTNFIFPNKVNVIEFSRTNEFSVFADIENNLSPLTSRDVMKKGAFNFCLNTNFYGKKNEALGEIIIEGKRYGKKNNNATGFFKIINGVPYAGSPGALFSNLSGNVEYSCQAFPSVIGAGKLWSYIENEADNRHRASWKKKTYRNLVGMKDNGDIVFIVSGNGGLLSVKEIATIARHIGIKYATLFDGGIVLQYKLKCDGFRFDFAAFNNKIELGSKLTQKSPVYVGVKIKE